MVQLKQLEKALETSVSEAKTDTLDQTIDEFLDDNETISFSNSSKLHDVLYRIWTSEELQNPSQNDDRDEDSTLTPVQTVSSIDANVVLRGEELLQSDADPRVIFLKALNRLGPCLINKDQLQVWWRELRHYGIDSTGHRLDLVELSRKFISGVLTESFYEYGDSNNSDLYSDLACSYGRPALELYLSKKLPENSKGEATEERIRFVRLNCRLLFGQFTRKETKLAFTMINEYFLNPKHRIDILDLFVEYLSESQNSKLFRIYETPFFESLLMCLEFDRARLAIQLALTALSMLLVHVCDKLVSNNLLFRIYACFGRACSWQPSQVEPASSQRAVPHNWQILEDDFDSAQTQPTRTALPDKLSSKQIENAKAESNELHDEESLKTASSGVNDSGAEKTEETIHLVGAADDNKAATESGTASSLSETRSSVHAESKDGEEKSSTSTSVTSPTKENGSNIGEELNLREIRADSGSEEDEERELEIDSTTLNVIPLFTFLYGLFPINTLQFCRHCDEYFAKHNYEKRVSDYWSRFMVTQQAVSIVRQFRIDPLLVKSTEDAELSGALTRFQEAGSTLGLSSICTSRRIVDVCGHGVVEDDPSSPEDGDNKNGESKRSSNESLKGRESSIDRLLNDHKNAFEMQPAGTADHWRRELLLIRNELAFANFSRDMSEQRALRWQKRSSDRTIVEVRNEELSRQNKALRARVVDLENEARRAARSARTIMRERSAYESKILDKNREFREKIKLLENTILEKEKNAESAVLRAEDAEKHALEDQKRTADADELIRDLRNELDAYQHKETARELSAMDRKELVEEDEVIQQATVIKLKEQIKALEFKMERLTYDNATALKALQKETYEAQAELAKSRQDKTRPRLSRASSQDTLGAVIKEKTATISRLRASNDELSRRCATLEHELRAHKVHEEERLNELQAALMSSRPSVSQDSPLVNRFRGRGGAQGVPRRL